MYQQVCFSYPKAFHSFFNLFPDCFIVFLRKPISVDGQEFLRVVICCLLLSHRLSNELTILHRELKPKLITNANHIPELLGYGDLSLTKWFNISYCVHTEIQYTPDYQKMQAVIYRSCFPNRCFFTITALCNSIFPSLPQASNWWANQSNLRQSI